MDYSKQGFEKTKVAVVGGAGFVGANLVKRILNENQNVQVVAIDNLLSAQKENLPLDSRLEFIKGSIASDQALEVLDDSYDFIFH